MILQGVAASRREHPIRIDGLNSEASGSVLEFALPDVGEYESEEQNHVPTVVAGSGRSIIDAPTHNKPKPLVVISARPYSAVLSFLVLSTQRPAERLPLNTKCVVFQHGNSTPHPLACVRQDDYAVGRSRLYRVECGSDSFNATAAMRTRRTSVIWDAGVSFTTESIANLPSGVELSVCVQGQYGEPDPKVFHTW